MHHRGFTLVEVLIVVVIMAVLAGAVIPYFGDSTKDAKVTGLKMNLRLLREQIAIYAAQHAGKSPTAGLSELLQRTDMHGNIGAGAEHIFGPYLLAMPENPLTGKTTVKTIASDPATAGDVTANNSGGWLYNPTTGSIYADHEKYFAE